MRKLLLSSAKARAARIILTSLNAIEERMCLLPQGTITFEMSASEVMGDQSLTWGEFTAVLDTLRQAGIKIEKIDSGVFGWGSIIYRITLTPRISVKGFFAFKAKKKNEAEDNKMLDVGQKTTASKEHRGELIEINGWKINLKSGRFQKPGSPESTVQLKGKQKVVFNYLYVESMSGRMRTREEIEKAKKCSFPSLLTRLKATLGGDEENILVSTTHPESGETVYGVNVPAIQNWLS